ncbi:MAG TPA: prepilin-type N-terminal cleavage/methylation domain-containing protein [Solirubrobacteraceae bacterium]
MERGFTLVEVMVAALILVVAVLGTLGLMDRSSKAALTTRDRDTATSLTRELIEASRAVPFPAVSTASLRKVVATRAGAAPGMPVWAWYRVKEGGTTFTIQMSACTFDDAADGGGNHAAGGFCAGSAAAGTADANAEDYKVITASTTWTRGVKRSVVQRTIVNDSGSTTAPAVTSLALRGVAPGTPVTSGGSLTLDFQTSQPATPVWRVDGVARTPPATGDGRRFSATWSLAGVDDGVYSLSAQGLDGGGRAGAGRSLSVTLNRAAPAAPLGLAGERRDAAVALTWQPSAERDVIGYTVYRRDAGGALTAVCVREPETECVDEAPARPGRYFVVASDLDAAGAPREGDPSAEVHVP